MMEIRAEAKDSVLTGSYAGSQHRNDGNIIFAAVTSSKLLKARSCLSAV
jgi:hypothetical protein